MSSLIAFRRAPPEPGCGAPSDLLFGSGRKEGAVPAARLGEQVFSSDGKIFVYAQANGAITASTAGCTVNASTFLATNSGGAYLSPATTMASGDQGWFGKASV